MDWTDHDTRKSFLLISRAINKYPSDPVSIRPTPEQENRTVSYHIRGWMIDCEILVDMSICRYYIAIEVSKVI
jgi:hypothetical protein